MTENYRRGSNEDTLAYYELYIIAYLPDFIYAIMQATTYEAPYNNTKYMYNPCNEWRMTSYLVIDDRIAALLRIKLYLRS